MITKEPDVCISSSPAIVLVDDEPIMLTVLSYALAYLAPHYEVIPLRNGAAALAQVAQRSVALIITDYHMPWDGWDCADRGGAGNDARLPGRAAHGQPDPGARASCTGVRGGVRLVQAL